MKTIFVAVVLAVCVLGALGDDGYGDDGNYFRTSSGYYPGAYATYGLDYGTSYPTLTDAFLKGQTYVTPRVTGYAKAVDTVVNQPYPYPVPVPGFGGPLAFGAGYGAAQNNDNSDDSGLLIAGGLLLLALLLRNSNTSG